LQHKYCADNCQPFCICNNSTQYTLDYGPGSSVGIATGYGLDGPGIETWWGRDFSRTSRPALGPTQPPVQWVPGVKWPGHGADHPPPSSAEDRMSIAMPLLPL
jgi:hypothetical protein